MKIIWRHEILSSIYMREGDILLALEDMEEEGKRLSVCRVSL